MKKYYLIFIFFSFVTVPLHAHEDHENFILAKREEQIVSSYSDVQAIEEEIASFKEAHGASQEQVHSSGNDFLLYGWHVAPFLVWQLLAMVAVAGIALGTSALRWLLLFLCIPMVIGYYERFIEWKVVSSPTACLYIGPSHAYPIRKQVHYLDEVKVKKRTRDVQGKTWLLVEKSGELGWLADE